MRVGRDGYGLGVLFCEGGFGLGVEWDGVVGAEKGRCCDVRCLGCWWQVMGDGGPNGCLNLPWGRVR